ncbi:hypothetical protein [Sphingomonas koreensis]|uniref:hypothetical protein n=1 Tax=Sphingomonas koreensis TaxID=93064 RepID=UPI000F7E8512|nr:hypothetical protein [Sphingomonas koreensis]MDC7808817.1 hypothetical protein [Sphingomonas koreensis]RSU98956.1 hypothetical protein CA256_03230 [Sphingomonas koreensis]
MTTDPNHHTPDPGTVVIIGDETTDAQWDTEIAHTPRLAAQQRAQDLAEGAAELPGGGEAND